MKRLAPTAALIALLSACRASPAPETAPAPAPAVTETAPAPVLVPVPVPVPVPETAAAGQVPHAFRCRGNEPSWTLDIDAGGALHKTPEAEVALLGALRANNGGSFAFRGAPDGSPEDEVSALITPGQCFDTLADGPASPFNVQASFADGAVASGCCSVEYGIDPAAAPAAEAGGKPAAD